MRNLIALFCLALVIALLLGQPVADVDAQRRSTPTYTPAPAQDTPAPKSTPTATAISPLPTPTPTVAFVSPLPTPTPTPSPTAEPMRPIHRRRWVQ